MQGQIAAGLPDPIIESDSGSEGVHHLEDTGFEGDIEDELPEMELEESQQLKEPHQRYPPALRGVVPNFKTDVKILHAIKFLFGQQKEEMSLW